MMRAGVAFAVGYWLLESAMHAFVFRSGPLSQQLVPRDANELWMRLVTCGLFVAFGAWAERARRRHARALEEAVRERKRRLAEAETRYRTLVEQLPAVTYVAAFEEVGRVLYVSPQCERLLGVPAAKVLADPGSFFECIHPEDLEGAKAAKARARATGGPFAAEYRMLGRDGRVVWVRDEAVVVKDDSGRPRFLQGVLLDITDRRSAEEKLGLQGAALEAAANAVVITDRDGAITWVNPAFTRLSGYTLEECRGQTPRLLRSGQQPPDLYARLWQTILSGQIWCGELVNRRKDGSLYLEEQTITPVTDERGRITHFIGVKVDITERRRAEEALRVSEERYRTLIERVPTGVYRTTLDGRILECNDAFARIYGYSSREEMRENAASLYPAPEARQELLERLALHGSLVGEESQGRRKDGTPVWVLENVSLVHPPDAEPLLEGTVVDVTERKNLEEQLRRAQKLEAVGQLAGGIAHDFNNILSVITGYCDLLLRHSSPDSRERRKLEEIRRAGERAVVLTRQLLTFSRQQSVEPEVLDVNAVLSEMEGMLRRLIREDIQLLTVFGSGLHPVRADRGQIEQVVVNLVVNARDAMPAGGRLVIETGEVLLDAEYCRTHLGAEPGLHLMLAVTDSGTGMDAETQSRIFEPFFTTKEEGKGTGLGLATVYGIAKQWRGSVFVYSEVGRGTTFKVYFPAVQDKAEALRPSVAAGEPPRGTEAVLLVEDDDTLRDLTGEILQDLGYTVLSARDGIAALEIYEKHDGPIHLLLTDLVMPRMSGRELAERLRSTRPETAALFMSGYTDDAVVRDGMLAAAVAFLQKPFTPEALARKVREALEQPRDVGS